MALRGLQIRALISGSGAAVETWLDAERNQLPLLAPVGLGLGIALWFLLPWADQRAAAAIVAAALVVAGLTLNGLSARMLVWGGLLMLAGLGVAELRSSSVAAPVLADRFTGDVIGTVDEIEIASGRDRFRFILSTVDPALPRRVRISVRGAAITGVVPGARVSVRASLSPPSGPSYPGGYDFARRAWFAELGATGYPLGPVVVVSRAPAPTGPLAVLEQARERLTARLKAQVPHVAGTLVAAFVTGDQGGIPEPIAQSMRDSGLAHLLSISGVHIAIVVGMTLWLIRRGLTLVPWIALRWPVKIIAAGGAALAGIGYTLLAGGQVPTVRTCIATLIVLVGVAAGREALTLRLVAAGAFLVMMVRPEALLGPSFQLSFAAVTGMVALYQSRLGQWLAHGARDHGWLFRLFRSGLALVVTGLVAEAMLSVTALYHFNRAGLFGVAANLVAIPLTEFVIMPLLVLALLFETVGLAAPLWWLVGKAMGWLIVIAQVVAAWPGAVVRLPIMPDIAYAALVGGGLWLCLWQTRVRWAGVLPIVAGVTIALLARPPDLLVSGDGRHAAYLVPDGRLALLRDRAGDYIRDMWGDATAATTADVALADLPGARCSIDACVADLHTGGRSWRLLATLSRDVVGRPSFEPACAAADIVVSARRLPAWCVPRWLKLDRAMLGDTGAVAIWLSPARVETVAARVGDHPWMPRPAPYVPGKRRVVGKADAPAAAAQNWD
ncbi:ComEC/Rec2 family competence protein [Glacieibacterium sp.]|uniref:ComEC/Rec2 family competence protein n=1 Tax=Glacieibacterium sp. TaxID=2860237 RepID=UPI003B004936